MRALADAQHEAAHVVVGLACGLRLWRVRLGVDAQTLGLVEWHSRPWWREGDLLMTAAGIAWERRCGDLAHARMDVAALRTRGVRGNARVRILEAAAWALLSERAGAHARVTRALLERDLTARDVAALARGERVTA